MRAQTHTHTNTRPAELGRTRQRGNQRTLCPRRGFAWSGGPPAQASRSFAGRAIVQGCRGWWAGLQRSPLACQARTIGGTCLQEATTSSAEHHEHAHIYICPLPLPSTVVQPGMQRSCNAVRLRLRLQLQCCSAAFGQTSYWPRRCCSRAALIRRAMAGFTPAAQPQPNQIAASPPHTHSKQAISQSANYSNNNITLLHSWGYRSYHVPPPFEEHTNVNSGSSRVAHW